MADALTWSADTVVCADTSGAPDVNTLSQENALLTKKDSLLMSIMTKTRHSLGELLKHRAAPYVMTAALALTPACTGVGENKDAVKAPSWTEPVSLSQSVTASPTTIAPVVVDSAPAVSAEISTTPEKTPSGRPAWAEGIKYKGTADGVLAFKQFNDEKTNKPEVIVTPSETIKIKPNETVNFQLLKPVSPDGTGLEQLVNTGTRLEQQTFEKVTHWQTALSEANYWEVVVPALYDMSDIETWLTNSDGTPMNAEDFASYKKRMEIVKKKWLGKLDEYKQEGKQELIDRWILLYNEYLPKVIHGSREEYRRLLSATNALALAQGEYTNVIPNFNARAIPGENGKTIDDVFGELKELGQKQRFAKSKEEREQIGKERKRIWENLEAKYDSAVNETTQLGELSLITSDKSALIKLERRDTKTGDTRKYIVPSDRDMEEGLHFKPGIYTTQHALAWWNAQQESAYMDSVELAQLDADNAQLDADNAQLDADKAKRDKRIARNEEYSDTLWKYTELSKKIRGEFTNLPKNTEGSYVEYVENLQADMKEFARLKRKLQTLPDDDPAFKAKIDEGFWIIQDMAKAHQISFPTT